MVVAGKVAVHCGMHNSRRLRGPPGRQRQPPGRPLCHPPGSLLRLRVPRFFDPVHHPCPRPAPRVATATWTSTSIRPTTTATGSSSGTNGYRSVPAALSLTAPFSPSEQAHGPLTAENAFEYFTTSMFYDKQSNNQVLRMQTMHTGAPLVNEAEELKCVFRCLSVHPTYWPYSQTLHWY